MTTPAATAATAAPAATATAVFFALQFFLRCSFFCVAVFFALQFFLRCFGFSSFVKIKLFSGSADTQSHLERYQVLSRVGGTRSICGESRESHPSTWGAAHEPDCDRLSEDRIGVMGVIR